MNASEEFFAVKIVVKCRFIPQLHMLTLLKTRLSCEVNVLVLGDGWWKASYGFFEALQIWRNEETPMRAGSGEQDA